MSCSVIVHPQRIYIPVQGKNTSFELYLNKCGTIFSSNLGAFDKKDEYRVTHKKLPCTTIARDNETEWIRFMGPNEMECNRKCKNWSHQHRQSLQSRTLSYDLLYFHLCIVGAVHGYVSQVGQSYSYSCCFKG